MDAFHDAWMRALKQELVTTENVASAPAELMRALQIALDNVPGNDPLALGKAAFAKWCGQPEEKHHAAPAGQGLH